MSKDKIKWEPGILIARDQYVDKEGKLYRSKINHSTTEEFNKDLYNRVKLITTESVKKPYLELLPKFAAHTSMDVSYYNKSGRHMLKSYSAHCGQVGPMYVYNEGEFDVKVKDTVAQGWKLGKEYDKFQARHPNKKVTTFSKKAFSIIHACENIDCDRLIWIDADCLFSQDLPRQLLELISPDDVLSTHFSVWHEWPSETDPDRIAHSCETGFFILNKRHPSFTHFVETYKDIYYNDKDQDLRRFYDGEVYGKTVEILESRGNKMLNLNPGRHKTAISRSVIAPYLAHFKAGLKDRINFDKFGSEEDEV